MASGIIQVKKVLGTSNPSDVLIKYVAKETLLRHLGTLGPRRRCDF